MGSKSKLTADVQTLPDNAGKKNKGGRPSILTRKLMQDILALVEEGNYLKDAVLAQGVYEQTYYRWIEKGEADRAIGKHTIHAQLCESATCARAKARTVHVGLILKNSKRGANAQASLEFLARTDRENWSKEKVKEKDEAPERVPADEMIAAANKALEDDPGAKEKLIAVLREMR